MITRKKTSRSKKVYQDIYFVDHVKGESFFFNVYNIAEVKPFARAVIIVTSKFNLLTN